MKTKYMYKSCVYCNGQTILHDNTYGVNVCIIKDKMMLIVNDKVVDKHTINYCPVCKDKLYINKPANKGAKKAHGCNYCNNDDWVYPILAYYDKYYKTSYQVFIEDDRIHLLIDDKEATSKRINRCPVCRRRLKKHYK